MEVLADLEDRVASLSARIPANEDQRHSGFLH
jgi:hypothetical protein